MAACLAARPGLTTRSASMQVNTLPSPTSNFSIAGDAVAISIIPLAWINVLPSVAAVLTIVWLTLQIFTWFINRNWKVRTEFKQVTTTTAVTTAKVTPPAEPPKNG